MDLIEFLFVVQLLGVLGITLVKVYNVMKSCEWYDLEKGFILFMAFFLCFGLGLVIFLVQGQANYDEAAEYLILSVFKFETWFVLLHGILMVIEVIFYWRTALNAVKSGPYMSNKNG